MRKDERGFYTVGSKAPDWPLTVKEVIVSVHTERRGRGEGDNKAPEAKKPFLDKTERPERRCTSNQWVRKQTVLVCEYKVIG